MRREHREEGMTGKVESSREREGKEEEEVKKEQKGGMNVDTKGWKFEVRETRKRTSRRKEKE